MTQQKKKRKKQPTTVSKKATKNSNKGVYIFTVIITFFIIGSFFVLSHDPAGDSTKIASFDTSNHPTLGNSDAKVTIVEFGDYKCPSCMIWEEQIFPKVKTDLIDTGKAKLVFFNYPVISADSYNAMEMAQSIYHQSNDAFWTFYSEIYKNQQDEKKAWATFDYLEQFTKDHVPGVDVEKAIKEAKNLDYKKEIDADIAAGNQAGVNSTPSIYVNGKLISNPYDYDAIAKAVEEGNQP